MVGCVLGLLIAAVSVGIAFALRTAVLSVALVQLLFAVPAAVTFFKYGKRRSAIGIVISACLLFLLSAACSGFVSELNHMH